MTEQERHEEYLKLVKLKADLEKDRSALPYTLVRFPDTCRYMANELDRLADWEPGAHSTPDLNKCPTAAEVKRLFADCKDNKDRLSKIQQQVDTFRP